MKPTQPNNAFAYAASAALIALIVLGIAQEMWLTPLRSGGSWLVLKVVPLFFCLRGALKRDNYTLQWSSMLILLYFTEGIVRATSDQNPLSIKLSWLEVALTILFFYSALSYLRPLKKAAKAAIKAAAKLKEINEQQALKTQQNDTQNSNDIDIHSEPLSTQNATKNSPQ